MLPAGARSRAGLPAPRSCCTGETFTWQTGAQLRAALDARAEPRADADAVRHGRRASLRAGQWFESDPLWFKHAVFYEIHIRGVLRRQRRRLRRPARPDRQARLPAVARRRLHLAAADVSVAAPRRRLRHRRLLRTSTRTTARSRTSASSIEAAHQRGIRVIADLVMNHTSSDHPWFQESRADRDGPNGDWYVWSDTDEPWQEARIIFLDTEPSNWTWDPVRGQYYWHRFFSHQPDLNYDNPEVQEAMLDVLRFWLDLGIDGFRLDAIPYLYERDGTNGENLARDARLPEARARGDRRELPGPGAARRGEPVARGRRRVLRRRRRVPHVLPLPRHAAHVHGAAPRGRDADLRDPRADAPDSGELRSGASSSATTTS